MVNFRLWHLILLSFFLIIHKMFYNLITKKYDLTEKQKSYILAFKNSMILSLISIYLNYSYFINGNLNSKICEIVIIYFTSYLLSDLIIGNSEYKSKINLVNGYIHHCVYICINLFSIYTSHTPFYSLFFLGEIPTFLLNYYNLFDKPKNKKFYSNLFLLFRVIALIFLTFFTLSDSIIKYFSIPIIFLHIYWYKKSIKSTKNEI
jgi:hypothetical protein